MSLLYGAGFSSNHLVIGTSNKSELLIGYWTKWGDGGTDFLPIGDLYKTQVFELGKILDIPSEILPANQRQNYGQAKRMSMNLVLLTRNLMVCCLN